MAQKNYEVVLPFSPAFKERWELWKQYKNEQHKFKYKTAISEQAALKHLVELSDGNEQCAEQIIERSIANGWKGLFEIKQSINGTGSKKPGQGVTKDAVKDALTSVLNGRQARRGNQTSVVF